MPERLAPLPMAAGVAASSTFALSLKISRWICATQSLLAPNALPTAWSTRAHVAEREALLLAAAPAADAAVAFHPAPTDVLVDANHDSREEAVACGEARGVWRGQHLSSARSLPVMGVCGRASWRRAGGRAEGRRASSAAEADLATRSSFIACTCESIFSNKRPVRYTKTA